ncbi:hypothetical protein PG988_007429 [Apiospora saccharicola]
MPDIVRRAKAVRGFPQFDDEDLNTDGAAERRAYYRSEKCREELRHYLGIGRTGFSSVGTRCSTPVRMFTTSEDRPKHHIRPKWCAVPTLCLNPTVRGSPVRSQLSSEVSSRPKIDKKAMALGH